MVAIWKIISVDKCGMSLNSTIFPKHFTSRRVPVCLLKDSSELYVIHGLKDRLMGHGVDEVADRVCWSGDQAANSGIVVVTR